jgi:hypothetical protein
MVIVVTDCYFCSSSEDIEEHHIVPQRFQGSDSEANTVDVCHDCHWKLERLYNKDFWEAIGIEDPRSTRESHITCYQHGCTEPSVGWFSGSNKHGDTRKGRYCKAHKPSSEPSQNDTYLVGPSTTTEKDRNSLKIEDQLNRNYPNSIPDEDDLVDILHELGWWDRNDKTLGYSADKSNKIVEIRARSMLYRGKYENGGWVVYSSSLPY